MKTTIGLQRWQVKEEYEVTISIRIFENTRKEYKQIVAAKSEREAREIVFQDVVDRLETKVTVTKRNDRYPKISDQVKYQTNFIKNIFKNQGEKNESKSTVRNFKFYHQFNQR
ncbi:MAG: hypothetical protein ACOXZ0_08385 [Eubacteriales bacterium]|jgi:hypothetical protein